MGERYMHYTITKTGNGKTSPRRRLPPSCWKHSAIPLWGESPLFAGVDYTTEIPLYNYSASSIKKGLYKILFGINYKPCYVIFEL